MYIVILVSVEYKTQIFANEWPNIPPLCWTMLAEKFFPTAPAGITYIMQLWWYLHYLLFGKVLQSYFNFCPVVLQSCRWCYIFILLVLQTILLYCSKPKIYFKFLIFVLQILEPEPQNSTTVVFETWIEIQKSWKCVVEVQFVLQNLQCHSISTISQTPNLRIRIQNFLAFQFAVSLFLCT